MAVFTRTNGNAQNVVSVGNIALSTEASTIGVPVSTGIGKPIQCFGITANTSTYNTNTGTGEAAEITLRALGLNATLLAYQVDGQLLSAVVEESAWNTTDLKANIDAALQAGGFNWSTTVTNVGLKLATS